MELRSENLVFLRFMSGHSSGVPKIRGTFLGVPTIRITCLGVYIGIPPGKLPITSYRPTSG